MPKSQRVKIKEIGDGDWFMVSVEDMGNFHEEFPIHADWVWDLFNVDPPLSTPSSGVEKTFIITVEEE